MSPLCPHCHADHSPGGACAGADPLLGATIGGRYLVSRRIGEGGMGVVYAAQHVAIRKPVALKVLHDRHADRAELAARLVNEARLASAIEHLHIINIFDVGETPDGRTWLAMELLDGESLAQLIRRDGPLPEARALDVVAQAASALGAAHDQGILHRDVKPENLFLVQRGGRDFVKVVDFGISRSLRAGDGGPDAQRLTQEGTVLGTPLYMSPEQARGDDDVDHRIDVYALGVILYECLTGEVPFRGRNYLGVISHVIADAPTPPRVVRPDLAISEGIERVVLRALEKRREDRYPSMAALEADLERVRAGRTPAALPAVARAAEASEDGAATVTPSTEARRSMRPIGAIAALLAGGAALLGWVVLATSAPSAARPESPGGARVEAPSGARPEPPSGARVEAPGGAPTPARPASGEVLPSESTSGAAAATSGAARADLPGGGSGTSPPGAAEPAAAVSAPARRASSARRRTSSTASPAARRVQATPRPAHPAGPVKETTDDPYATHP